MTTIPDPTKEDLEIRTDEQGRRIRRLSFCLGEAEMETRVLRNYLTLSEILLDLSQKIICSLLEQRPSLFFLLSSLEQCRYKMEMKEYLEKFGFKVKVEEPFTDRIESVGSDFPRLKAPEILFTVQLTRTHI